jgi:Zn-dependent peptidase ImmA (M78 family)/transcriptional regulator with XRE-family HTH domain
MVSIQGGGVMNGRDLDMTAVADRVRRARRAARMNQTELAAAAGVSQATVSRIEKGQRGVSLTEADALAQALQMPLDTLLHGSQVAERVLVALRADNPDHPDRHTAIAAGVRLLELDERLDAVIGEHRQQARDLPVQPPTSGSATARGALLAGAVREADGLGCAPIAELTELTELVEEMTGVDVATRPLSFASGMCLVDEARTTRLLVVNSDEPAERQRFTLAHELGHLLFGDGAHIDGLDAGTGEAETRCNEFARNLLVPADGVRNWLRRTQGTDAGPVDEQAISLMSRFFGVTAEVVRIQLERMGVPTVPTVPSTPALASRFGWRAEYEATQAAARRPRPPRRLAQRAAQAYAHGRLGATVLAELEGRTVAEVEADREQLIEAQPRTAPAGLASLDELLALAGEPQR